MPKFEIEFTRDWIETDTVERVIEAESADQAAGIAADMCSEFDRSCPDDVVSSKGGSAGDWRWSDIGETDEPPSDEVR